MKINTAWLREDFGINIPEEKLINILTRIGFEVEGKINFDGTTILDINVTPNRGDCLSHMGIARELLAAIHKRIPRKRIVLKETEESCKNYISVKVESKELCPRYCARVIRNVKIAGSPDWLKKRLESVGIRSINNVVDVTNYVLMELGHPLHAFDLDRIKGNKIIVRRAQEGEKIKTLDGVERVLTHDNLVIADEKEPVALAGVMGGANSEVTEDTKNLLIEAAVFLPGSIQKTSKALKIETESSFRFSRGVDYSEVVYALDRAAGLIHEIAGGEVLRGFLDVKSRRLKKGRVKFSLESLNTFIGEELREREVVSILSHLQFKVTRKGKDLIVEIPSFRNDIRFPADIYEEVARHYGYDKIPTRIPPGKLTAPEIKTDIRTIIRRKMEALGFWEVITYSFINPDYKEKLFIKDDIQDIPLLNPLSIERSVMRPMLVPGVFESANYNINHGNNNLKIYELGKVFSYDSNHTILEKDHICGLITGIMDETWYSTKRHPDFFDAKGVIESIFDDFEIKTLESSEPFLIPGRQAGIYFDEMKIGFMGEVLPGVRERYDIKAPCVVFELDLSWWQDRKMRVKEFRQIPKLLAVDRDIAIVVEKKILVADIVKTIRKMSELISSVRVFDVYEGKNIPAGKRSIAFRITIQPDERNLTDEEINNIISSIAGMLKKEYNAELRGNV